MELVPVPLVPTCPTKWVYKAVKFSFWQTGSPARLLGETLANRADQKNEGPLSKKIHRNREIAGD